MNFFQWLGANWGEVCGWIGAAYTLYKLGSIVSAVVGFFSSLTGRFKNAENTLSLLATNHLPHIQAELEKFNSQQDRHLDLLSEIRDDLRLILFERKHYDE